MAHDWDRIDTMFQEKRKCKNCGKEQELVKDYAWMRVVTRRWEPRVGRCEGLTKTRAKA